MKTKYKFIEFSHLETKEEDIWICTNNKSKDKLGYCEYYKRWKEWQFFLEDMTAFTVECLRDIADFLDQLNKK